MIGYTGQLCNQLFRFAHHTAHALANDYVLHNVAFEYASSFPAIKQHKQIKLTPLNRSANRIGQALLSKLSTSKPVKTTLQHAGVFVADDAFSLQEQNQDFTTYAQHKMVFAINWLFRDFTNFNQFSDQLRVIFQPQAHVIEQSSERIETIRKEFDVVVGVHIRRGDYADFHGGRYYYENAVYHRYMNHLETLFPTKRVAFLVCSNEVIDTAHFPGVAMFNYPSPFMTDLTSLSLCDFLIGPPSTFSLWASFMGNKRYYHIDDPTSLPSLENFQFTKG